MARKPCEFGKKIYSWNFELASFPGSCWVAVGTATSMAGGEAVVHYGVLWLPA